MITKNIKREQLSALADGELDAAASEALLKSLGDDADLQDWELYHRIGDTLRSEELASPLSAGFAARMAARLDAEAPHQAMPMPSPSAGEVPVEAGGVMTLLRRYLVPGMAGTAAVVMAMLMGVQWGADTSVSTDAPIAVQAPGSAAMEVVPVAAPDSAAVKASVSDSQTLVAEDDIVRDPHIDQYLMAHQRFSPAAYSSSQFARSATFATEAEK